jgi:hypothetical protein
MDQQTRQDMYTMAEWAATLDALDRLHERRARRRKVLRFWLNVHQVVYEPTVAVATPGAHVVPDAPTLGVASGPAGSTVRPPTASPTSSAAGRVTSPASPLHSHSSPPPRISSGITWN